MIGQRIRGSCQKLGAVQQDLFVGLMIPLSCGYKEGASHMNILGCVRGEGRGQGHSDFTISVFANSFSLICQGAMCWGKMF